MDLRSDQADVASALDEVATGLGYIVGRRASMPEGSRVRIDLSGPAGRTYLVLVEGRAAVVDSFDGPPTVGIELPSPLFLRLTGGRHDDGPTPVDEVRFSGDRHPRGAVGGQPGLHHLNPGVADGGDGNVRHQALPGVANPQRFGSWSTLQ